MNVYPVLRVWGLNDLSPELKLETRCGGCDVTLSTSRFDLRTVNLEDLDLVTTFAASVDANVFMLHASRVHGVKTYGDPVLEIL